MNPITRALGVLVRSWRLRGQEGWVAPRPVMALAVVMVGLVGLGVAAVLKYATPSAPPGCNSKPLDHDRPDPWRGASSS